MASLAVRVLAWWPGGLPAHWRLARREFRLSVQYRIEDGILRVSFAAASTSEQIFVAINKAYQDPDCPAGADIVLDVRSSTSIGARSLDNIRHLSQIMVNHPARPGRRVAILLQHGEAERLSPMAVQFSQETGLDIRIFEDEDTACAWLGHC